MSHRTNYGSLATYVAHRALNEQKELRALLVDSACRAIAAGLYSADDLPSQLWHDLQDEKELTF
jgi:3-hydroxy-3-methylglutaryl CoA synthase